MWEHLLKLFLSLWDCWLKEKEAVPNHSSNQSIKKSSFHDLFKEFFESISSSGNTDAFIVEKHTKLHKEKVLFSKVPWNYFLSYFYILYFCIAALGAVVLHSLSMNTLTIMVNL